MKINLSTCGQATLALAVALACATSHAANTVISIPIAKGSYSCEEPVTNNNGYIAAVCLHQGGLAYANTLDDIALRPLSGHEVDVSDEYQDWLMRNIESLNNNNQIISDTRITLSPKGNGIDHGISEAVDTPAFFSKPTTSSTAEFVDMYRFFSGPHALTAKINDSGYIAGASSTLVESAKSSIPAWGPRSIYVLPPSAITDPSSTTPTYVTSSSDGSCSLLALTNTTVNNYPALLASCASNGKKSSKYITIKDDQKSHQIQSIPSPDGYTCEVTQLNNKFHAAGSCKNSGGRSYAAFWPDVTKAPTLFQGAPSGSVYGSPFNKYVFALNDLDHLLVTYKDNNGNSRILLWQTDAGASIYKEVGVAGSNYTPIGLANNDTYVYIESSAGKETSYYRLANEVIALSLGSLTGAPANLRATSLSQNGLWIAATAKNPNGAENQVYRVSLGN